MTETFMGKDIKTFTNEQLILLVEWLKYCPRVDRKRMKVEDRANADERAFQALTRLVQSLGENENENGN